MEFQLKALSKEAIPAALERRAARYRLRIERRSPYVCFADADQAVVVDDSLIGTERQ